MAWLVLTLVFVDELLLIAATAVWGADSGGWPLAVAAPLATVAAWWAFASPKAAYGGPIVRPLVKAVVFASGSAALWAAGHPGWALALLVFSVVINALAQLPPVLRVHRTLDAAGPRDPMRSAG